MSRPCLACNAADLQGGPSTAQHKDCSTRSKPTLRPGPRLRRRWDASEAPDLALICSTTIPDLIPARRINLQNTPENLTQNAHIASACARKCSSLDDARFTSLPLSVLSGLVFCGRTKVKRARAGPLALSKSARMKADASLSSHALPTSSR